jgi:hypothetical protein
MKKNNEEVLTIDLDWIRGPRQEIDIIALCVKLFLLKIDTYFVKAHHHAFDLVPENSILYNIDHHHDMCYFEDGYDQVNNKIIREGSWILALALYKKLKGYIWIKNYDSLLEERHVRNVYRELDIFKISDNLEDLEVKNFSKLIICESASYDNEKVNLSKINNTLIRIARLLDVNFKIISHYDNDFSYLKVEDKK